MTTITLNKNTKSKIFIVKKTFETKKNLSDYNKYIIKSGKKETENISENIDNILYK
ncbi:MAG: hypothetical protein Q8K30_02835 [Candidatus Gracilibacteria bacterium]|nr:hypothetical protein [Candidatus Gracilibacteria bacterium]